METLDWIRTALAIGSPIFAAGIGWGILKITEKGMERLATQFDDYKTTVVPEKIGDVYEYVNKKDEIVNSKIDKVAEDVAYIRGKLNGLLK